MQKDRPIVLLLVCALSGVAVLSFLHCFQCFNAERLPGRFGIGKHAEHFSRGKHLSSTALWATDATKSQGSSAGEQKLSEIPSFVLAYAPFVHLFSKETYWPADIAEHLFHTKPYLNYTPRASTRHRYNLTNLDELNDHGPFTYLQSDDNVEDHPDWLTGKKNIPVEADTESEPPTLSKAHAGRSNAPAILIVVKKPHGIVDAFWFFFYSFNHGNAVFNIPFGNHVGDWEHTVVRFEHGKPHAVFLSEHTFGEAYSYAAMEKIGRRPVVYSSVGTHAMYATPGRHNYIIPFGLLHDETDRGPLWDPALNCHAYTYDYLAGTLHSSNMTPQAPTEWFKYIGHWGDKAYPMSDSRQYRFAGQNHYVDGPRGPRFKNLGRKQVCQGRGKCNVRQRLSDNSILHYTRHMEHGRDASQVEWLTIPIAGDDVDEV